MENEKGIVKLTRKQLYDEIWALSVAGVARKYNLNYGKLIATCKVESLYQDYGRYMYSERETHELQQYFLLSILER